MRVKPPQPIVAALATSAFSGSVTYRPMRFVLQLFFTIFRKYVNTSRNAHLIGEYAMLLLLNLSYVLNVPSK
jgi:hypothetical protein